MLKPAQLYRDELKQKLMECWDNPKYDYYFNGEYQEFDVPQDRYWRSDYVCVDNKGEIVGYFAYCRNDIARSLSHFGLISFTDNGALLMRDCIARIDKLVSEGLNRIEWWAIVDNPANKIYEKLVKRYGGTVAGYMHDCNYFGGKYHDSVMYEILFEEV